jgi:hypothetical protein
VAVVAPPLPHFAFLPPAGVAGVVVGVSDFAGSVAGTSDFAGVSFAVGVGAVLVEAFPF